MPSIDKLLTLTTEKAFIRTSQSFEFENKWLGFGRMTWDENNNVKWTTKYRTIDNESKLHFYQTEIWAPDWNEFNKSGVPPDVYVKLYNNPNSQTTREGLIIAIPKRMSLKRGVLIENEIQRLTELIPNSTLTMTTRLWYPWFRFVNNIDDMNPHELEKVINKG